MDVLGVDMSTSVTVSPLIGVGELNQWRLLSAVEVLNALKNNTSADID